MTKKHHYPYPDQRIYERCLKRYNNLWKKIFPEQYLEEGAHGRIFSDGTKFLEAFSAAHVSNIEKKDCLHFLKLANQFCQTHFRLAFNIGEQFTVELDGQLIPVEGKKPTGAMSVHEWQKAFYLAVLLRDEEHMIGTLGRYRAENYIDPGAEALAIDYPYYQFLQGLYKPNVDLQPILQDIATFSGPEHMPERRQGYIYYIWLPFIEVILTILNNNQAEYEKAIIKALDNHIHYFSKGEQKYSYSGWVSLPICTAAAMAYDKYGFKLPISSPYLPEWLIYHEFG